MPHMQNHFILLIFCFLCITCNCHLNCCLKESNNMRILKQKSFSINIIFQTSVWNYIFCLNYTMQHFYLSPFWLSQKHSDNNWIAQRQKKIISEELYTHYLMTEVETTWSDDVSVTLCCCLTMVGYGSLVKIILPNHDWILERTW
jgi:hypothetical protein